MFAPRYFPNRYFARRYWPKAGATAVETQPAGVFLVPFRGSTLSIPHRGSIVTLPHRGSIVTLPGPPKR